jgi:ABC-type sugar transport system substrate-binding protein
MVTRFDSLSAAALLALLSSTAALAQAPRTSPEDSRKNAAALVEFDKAGVKADKTYRIAYLTECVDNPYCVQRLNGIKDAVKKFGLELKVFDAQWSLVNQTKAVQNAVNETFDGYIFGPLAAQPSCALWKSTLKPTGRPVVTVTVPMCGDADYTPGLAATITMQGPVHYQELVDHAFSSCSEKCKVAAIGGFIGSDLQNYWEAAVKNAAEKYPNADVVRQEAANFDPRIAFQKTQDSLTAHPDISVIVSNWDDMTRGIEQGVNASGKKAGSDVRIYSAGANKDTVEKIKAGSINASIALLPYEEGYYATIAVLMGIQGKGVNGYVDEADLPEITTKTGTTLITKENAANYTAKY